MPPFRDPHGMSIAHATCDHSLSALSNPPDFVAALCRDDTIAVDICINGQLLYYCHFFVQTVLNCRTFLIIWKKDAIFA